MIYSLATRILAHIIIFCSYLRNKQIGEQIHHDLFIIHESSEYMMTYYSFLEMTI
jgi:hypothetical protein